MSSSSRGAPPWQAGIARRSINPPPGVESAGLGYYLGRTWQRIRDPLTVTALVITDEFSESVALVAMDLMYNDAPFARRIRELAAIKTGLRPEALCVNCSHTHNAPTAGLILGGGEQNAEYLAFAAEQAAAAVAEAWNKRQPARLSVGRGELSGMTFNRARENGPTDTSLHLFRVDTLAGRPLALAVNFHSHCTAHMEVDLRAISRDWPGELVDQLEAAIPGLTALYLQGTCGDVNFRREFNGTDRRFEPARCLVKEVLATLPNMQPVERHGIAARSRMVSLPARRWEREEIMRDREEGIYRLRTGDTSGWLDGLARVCVNQPERLPLRYGGSVERAVAAIARFAVEWTDAILPVLETRPEFLSTEVQAIRIGDVYLAAHGAELFTSLGLDLRRRFSNQNLFMLGYSNGSLGYLPDVAEIDRRGYAALQSPKFTGQFPFTADSGPALVDHLLAVLGEAGQKF